MYTHTSFIEFNNLVAAKLGDINKVYWTNDEINSYIKEALQTFGFISQFWKQRLFLKTQIDKNYYDLYIDLDNISQEYIVKGSYDDIVNLINLQLIETLSILNPISELYDLNNVIKYIDKRLDEFLVHTGLNIGIYELPLLAGIYKYEIPSYILDIVRISYKDSNDKYKELKKEDEGNLNYFDFDYLQDDTEPIYYTRVLDSNNLLKVYPKPINNSTLQLVCLVSRNKSLALTNDNVVYTEQLLIPRDALSYIKWGVLSDLLRQDGLGQDLNRSNYCLQRWNEGLIVGKAYTSILNAYVNEVPISLDSLSDIDYFNPDWQNIIQALDGNNIPITNISSLILIGYNLFFTDIISKAIANIELDCVVSAPISSDYIEIREEYLNILLDYIVHLASFKEGFARIESTSNLLNNFLTLALSHNYRLKQQGVTIEYLLKKTKVQEEQDKRGVNMVTQNS